MTTEPTPAQAGAGEVATGTPATARPTKSGRGTGAGTPAGELPTLGPRRPYLTFLCGGDRYAASILKIREILGVGAITRVPSTPRWIRGVMNLRGSVVPVIDFAVKLDLPPTLITARSCIVIVEVDLASEQVVMGVLVDAVEHVIELSREEIEPPPAFGTRVHVGYLIGMARVRAGELALVLDADRVLSVDELLTAAALEAPEDAERIEEADG